MSATAKMTYATVYPVACEIVDKLRPYCERIELAGSLRRKRPYIGDIEIVAIPRLQRDLFGQLMPASPTALDGFLVTRQVPLSKDGTRYKQFKYGRFTVDLFLQPDPATWGVNFLIRTGSQEFSRAFVTSWHRGGMLPPGFHVAGARLYRRGELLSTPEEQDVFEAIGRPWVRPEDR